MKPRSEIREQVLAFFVGLAAALVVFVMGAPDRWLAAIFITIVTFAGVISYFRGHWSSRRFWEIMAGAFVVHLGIIWLVFGILLRSQRDVGLLVCVPAIFLEAFLIYHTVLFLEGKAGLSHAKALGKQRPPG